MTKFDRCTPAASPATQQKMLGVLRIVLAFLFVQHGTAKLFAFPHVAMFDGLQITSLIGVAGILEVAGGLALLFGVATRSVSFLLSGMMAVAFFMAHAPKGMLPILNGGELAAIYSFAFLYLAVAGGGAYSLDGLCRKSGAPCEPCGPATEA